VAMTVSGSLASLATSSEEETAKAKCRNQVPLTLMIVVPNAFPFCSLTGSICVLHGFSCVPRALPVALKRWVWWGPPSIIYTLFLVIILGGLLI
jgi:hypothetical protein